MKTVEEQARFAEGTPGEVVDVRQVVYVRLATGPTGTITATFDGDELERAS